MKISMKFTLAVFCMLLAGAAGSTYHKSMGYYDDSNTWVSFVDDGKLPCRGGSCGPSEIGGAFNAGCRNLRRGMGKEFATNVRRLSVDSTLRDDGHIFSDTDGLDDMLNGGCVLCAPGINRAKCHQLQKELEYYMKFKIGRHNKEHGRITPDEPFCTTYYDQKPSDSSGYTPSGLKCRDSMCNGKRCQPYGPGNWDATLRTSGLDISGWNIPELWHTVILGDQTEFTMLKKVTECFKNGCHEEGFTAPVVARFEKEAPAQHVQRSLPNSAHGGSSPGYSTMTVEELQDLYWFDTTLTEEEKETVKSFIDAKNEAAGSKGGEEECVGTSCRKTIDAKGPAPVNQSKGFDGYQTALIVGLSVLSSFITAGSIYACRRLNEKAIELPVDVEEQNVAL